MAEFYIAAGTLLDETNRYLAEADGNGHDGQALEKAQVAALAALGNAVMDLAETIRTERAEGDGTSASLGG